MRILVISNMYPSASDPVYGTFVKVFYDNLSVLNGKSNTSLVALKGRYGRKCLKYLKFYLSVLRYLIFKNYDLIYVHTITYPIPPIWLVSKLKKLPLVFNVHGSDLLGTSSLVKKFHSMGQSVINNAKCIVSPSHYFKERIHQYFPLYCKDNIFVSASGGVDLSAFRPVSLERSNKEFILGYVARIDKGKGWEVYLKALASLLDRGYSVRGVIAGRGAQEDDMRNMISQLGLEGKVTYLGGVPREQLAQVYSGFDLFCNPSCLDESLGLVTIESMACGVPVVGSNNAGIAECIEDNNDGFLFKVGDYEDLVDKVITYIELPEEQKDIFRKNAVQAAQKYDTHRVMAALYEKLKEI